MISGKIYRFRANENLLDPRYLEFFLLSREAQLAIDKMKTGISDSGVLVCLGRFLSLEVPLFSLDEQRRIVDILEDHLSRLDAATELIKTSIKRVAALQELALRAELNATVPEKPLVDVIAEPLANGRSVRTRDDGFPVLRLTSLSSATMNLREFKGGDWTADEAKPFLVREGDFMVARGNGSLKLVGKGAIVEGLEDAVAFPDTMIRVRPNVGALDTNYLERVWNSRVVREQIESQARTTAGIYKVNQQHLRSIMLPVPPIDEQRAIAQRLNDLAERIQHINDSALVAVRRASSLRNALFSAAFSGKLTSRAFDQDRIEEMAS
jgi:type I restriction enzyme S subunit